ncbi:uncharacterized protein LOC126907807 [Daktulosphaira vitifoliae]|uniref:uncharacterized protein LOC126907807 n=1 Tax=Daktulosphaira vitifoliae TaxID=58002 RepID=UPI0021AA13D0|nr:uncharacterized protein LOC126907807 [Daktulosphaira vitifoliae]
MFSLKPVKYSFLIFYMVLYTKSERNSMETTKQLDELLKYSGWLNLNHLISITYYNKRYYLQNLIETPTVPTKCNLKIRGLTIYLGCIYAKLMDNLLLVISEVLQKCKKKLYEEHDFLKGRICTEELITIISLYIVPLATLMKGAIDNLHYMHTSPWTIQRNNYMICLLLKEIRNISDILNKQTLSRNNLSSYFRTLETINSFFKNIIECLHCHTNIYCNFVSYNRNYLWNEWNREYASTIDNGVPLDYFTFLNRKIQDYIETIIIENYFELGFKFHPITEESFIPTANDPFEREMRISKKLPTPVKIENY